MLLVFLHGKGYDENAYKAQLQSLSRSLSADYISFNAPFEHPKKPNKFLWFNKIEKNGHREVVKEEYLHSLTYIKKYLQNLNHPLSDIILIGHSQGGCMAISVALEMNLKGAISICGDLPYDLEYTNKSSTPIYWLEAAQDGHITQERKDSWQTLNALHATFNYQKIDHCTHDEIDAAFNEIKNILSGLNA